MAGDPDEQVDFSPDLLEALMSPIQEAEIHPKEDPRKDILPYTPCGEAGAAGRDVGP